jgi:hypothetical protein
VTLAETQDGLKGLQLRPFPLSPAWKSLYNPEVCDTGGKGNLRRAARILR